MLQPVEYLCFAQVLLPVIFYICTFIGIYIYPFIYFVFPMWYVCKQTALTSDL